MDILITLMWSFSLYRLITLKVNPVISFKQEVSSLVSYGIFFTIILMIILVFFKIFS